MRERPKLVPTTTVDMASIGSPDIGSSPPESHDRRVTQTEDSCDIVGGSCDSHVTEKSPSSIAARFSIAGSNV